MPVTGVRLVEAEQAPLLARPFYANGDPGPIVAALAQVPELLEVTMPFLDAALGPSAVEARTKELVILRTSAVMGCRYCIQTHTVVARNTGLSVEEVAALRGEAPLEAAFTDPRELRGHPARGQGAPAGPRAGGADLAGRGHAAAQPLLHGPGAADLAQGAGSAGGGGVELTAVAEAVRDEVLPGRVWFYANYHCNLACTYCLTESDPRAERRELGEQRMLALANEAAELGFTALGVTGGEPFLLPYLPELLARLAAVLPVVCLSNGTVFTEHRLERLRPLAELPAQIQISLDRPDPDSNDAMRGPQNFRKVVDAIPRLVERGVRVRIATTVTSIDDEERERLCRLHRRLGVPDADHVIRPIVRRGRAVDHGLGVDAGPGDLPAELTITTDGAFWSPFGPTVHGGRLDTDLLITRTTTPLRVPAAALLRLVQGRPAGTDSQLNIR
jgi:AhpD family alkylhydroperoxidase